MSDQPLPVIHSLADPRALERQLSALYFAGRPVDLELLSRSWTDVYRVFAGGERAVLRMWRADFHAGEQIGFTCALLTHLASLGFHVAPPIATLNGDLVVPLRLPEGLRHMALFAWVDGEKLGIGADASDYEAAGRLLARFHDAGPAYPGQVPVRPTLTRRLERLGGAIERLLVRRRRSPRVIDAMLAVAAAIEAPEVRALPGGIVHGDFHPFNLLRTAGGLHLLDFDDAGPAPLASDIAAFRWVLHYLQASDHCFTAFVSGYESVRPVTAPEWAAMPLLEAARDCWNILGWASSIDQLGDPADMLGATLDAAVARFAALG